MAKTPDELKDAMADLRESMTKLTASIKGGDRDDMFAAIEDLTRVIEKMLDGIVKEICQEISKLNAADDDHHQA